ncbi:hypothetical protein EDB83DRAFT_219235 [Lactarius deliciosus]|nr:hypothetical protein EDB83DRAFT_219235 [Lactarius deliciosus]
MSNEPRFLRLEPLGSELTMEVEPTSSSRTGEITVGTTSDDIDGNVDELSLKHRGYQCSFCQQDIVGPRFHCIECNEDTNICSDCEIAGSLDASNGKHSSSHITMKVPVPINDPQDVSQRVHGHWQRHSQDHTDLRLTSGSVSSISYRDSAGTDTVGGYIHSQSCNSCEEPIIGIRYQCLNCPSKPSSFNLCSDCEVKSYRVHDPMHAFLKIPRPVDIPGPLESEFPIMPILYRDPAGPPPGSPSSNISSDPAAYLRDLTHAFARCDRHMQRIVGKWYRCAYCAKDLCADCEVFDTHDSTHVFLVIKAPVDMKASRHFADLENPAGSPPVLRGNIYLGNKNSISVQFLLCFATVVCAVILLLLG